MSEDIRKLIEQAESAYADFLKKMEDLERARLEAVERVVKSHDQEKIEALRRKILG